MSYCRLILFSTLFLACSIAAEAQRDCGTMAVDARLRAEDPAYALNRQQIESFTQNYIATHPAEGMRSVVVVPTVIHVVYHSASQNLSDAQLMTQMDVLNEDYRRTNADAAETPPYFAGVAADCEIEFCLASTDPDGNPTSGITRTSSTRTSFTTDDKVKFTSQGGEDAWPADSYLNIWVCNLSGGLLGYAQFPGGPDATDGIVCDYAYFGRGGTALSPYDLGRTATHEVGHWLNCYHVWGDDGNACYGTDYCDDIPNQADETYGCPSGARVSCSNGPNGDMYENYMDYTDDACMNIFTNDQKARMQALFAPGGARYSILSSNGCSGGGGGACEVPTGLNATDIAESSAVLNWSPVTGAVSYNVQAREVGTGTWTTGSTTGTNINFTGLSAGTDYEFQVQTDCGGSLSAFSSSAYFTTPGGGACSDDFEPNDTHNIATVITPGVTYNAMISPSGDNDWFKFTTVSPNTKIRVTMTSLPADYDMKLYKGNKLKGTSDNSGTADEEIIWNTNQAGSRFINVYGYADASDPSDCYELLVEVSNTAFRTLEEEPGESLVSDAIVNIYPNPAMNTVNIDYSSTAKTNVQVVITDLLGRVVKTSDNAVAEGGNIITFDVSDLAPGIYITTVSDGIASDSGKFIVQ